MSESTVEGTRVNFAKGEKVTPVNILNEKKIGEGSFGNVYEADVSVYGRKRKFVIKRFHEAYIKDHAPAKAVENYQRAKKAGLKVFPTYRISEDGTSILMTNGNSDPFICVAAEDLDSSLSRRGESEIEIEDDKFEKLAARLFQQARLATKHHIFSSADSIFFLINRETNDVDFVFGDMDMVNTSPIPEAEYKKRLKINLSSMHTALKSFISDWNIENADRYSEKIREMGIRIDQGNFSSLPR